ncbi:MAG: PQQ-binding-like beta-propeller repeat protein, partial [Planctomycetota bacterium]
RALREEDLDAAFAALVALVEGPADVLVPVPEDLARGPGAWWPAPRVAEVLLARLPESGRAKARARWGVGAASRLERARAEGNEEILSRLADQRAFLPEGRTAIALLVARDLEAGRAARVVRRARRWLRLAGEEDGPERARMVMQLAVALDLLGDRGARMRLAQRFPGLVEPAGPLPGPGPTRGDGARAKAARLLPSDPVVLWTRPLEGGPVAKVGDPWGREGWPVGEAGGQADGDDLLLAEDGLVRRIEAHTGREIWRFPARSSPPARWRHDPLSLYLPYDRPVRSVTPAGDLVLAVLGEPGATGTFTYLGGTIALDDLPREHRGRLVALDRATGRPRWWTGGRGETDPVLGDPATSCASPPFVDGDRVLALFARRRGGSEIHLAALDRESGRVLWVRFLGTGESGRARDVTEGAPRFAAEGVQAVPWGARPAVAGDEICVVPHAGFAAGLDRESGRIRWLRQLPRYDGTAWRLTPEGFSARNAPQAVGSAWLLAPMDSPRLVALARGSGRLVWSLPAAPPDESPSTWHLLGVRAAAGGGSRLRLMGRRPVRIDLAGPDPRVESPSESAPG